MLVSRKDFDPDVQVLFSSNQRKYFCCAYLEVQDSAGWTPLMIASSLREGEDVIDVLLKKEADVNVKSTLVQSELSAGRKGNAMLILLAF